MISKVVVLAALVVYVAFASYAAFGPPPTRALAVKGWVCAAVLLVVVAARMR
jgi:hypothetical protein